MPSPGELYELSGENIPELDQGRLAAAFDQILEIIGKDCIDRPTDARARKLTLTFSVVPKTEYDDETRSVQITGTEVDYEMGCKLPSKASKKLGLGIQSNGKMIFNVNSPEDHRVQSLPFPPDD